MSISVIKYNNYLPVILSIAFVFLHSVLLHDSIYLPILLFFVQNPNILYGINHNFSVYFNYKVKYIYLYKIRIYIIPPLLNP